MPHVALKLVPGKSEQQKADIARKIVNAIVESLDYDEDAISLTIEEVSPAEWTKKVYQPDIRAKWDKLYKKPGYRPS